MRALLLLVFVGLVLAPVAVPTVAATSCVDDLGGALCAVILRGLCAMGAVGQVSYKPILNCVLP